MRVFLDIARTGVEAVVMHPQRSVATVAVLWAILTPFLVGLGLSQGIQREAAWSLEAGPDLYVTATRFGRSVPIPLSAVERLRRIPGVDRVTPRIVGPVTLGRERIDAVVVGLPVESIYAGGSSGAVDLRSLDGRLYGAGPTLEVVIGAQLARQLKLRPGDRIPPFYRNRHGERVARVVGVFHPTAPPWQAKVVCMSFESAAEIFDQPDVATELLVDCRPGYAERVRERIVRDARWNVGEDNLRPTVISREQYSALLSRGVLHRDGLINLHYVMLSAGGILVVLVTSGVGLDQRRREVALLKATGWQTDEVLLRGMTESLVLSVAATGLAITVAFAWLRGLNGWGIARLYLAGADLSPDFVVPFRLGALPVLTVLIVAVAMTLSGTLVSIWRAAATPPWLAMR